MNNKNYAIIAIIALMSIAGALGQDEVVKENPGWFRLMGGPENYHGKTIDLEGWFYFDDQTGSATLYFSREAMQYKRESLAVHLEYKSLAEFFNNNDRRWAQMNDRLVTVTGEFDKSGIIGPGLRCVQLKNFKGFSTKVTERITDEIKK